MLGVSYGGYSYPGGSGGSFSEVFVIEQTIDVATGLSVVDSPRLRSATASSLGFSSGDMETPKLSENFNTSGAVIATPSPNLSGRGGVDSMRLVASQAPAYTQSQYIDADSTTIDADAAVDSGHIAYAIQSGTIGTQRSVHGINGKNAPAPAAISGDHKPSGKIVISIPR